MAERRPVDPDFARRVRENFARQGLMATLGAQLEHVAAGEVRIVLVPRAAIAQQHGYVHAGAVSSILDSACGYAAYTLMAADAEVLSVEFKVNLLAPARGERIVAHGHVVRAGRTLTVCHADAWAHDGGHEVHVATMVGTMMQLRPSGR